MARWADNLSSEEQAQLMALLRRLLSVKPTGWSCLGGDRELILRPGDRSLGKFSITVSVPTSRICMSYFSPSLGHWDGREYFPFVPDSAEAIVSWAQTKIGESAV